MMNYPIVSALLFTLMASIQSNSFAESDSPVVIELFTSQGCYSCPPADKFLGELSHQKNTIALSCHVTYWNYLGWRDTFSHQFCDNRQRNYQAHLQGNPGVYTPQMVVSGRFGAVGSRTSRVNHIIDVANKRAPLQKIHLSIDNDDITIGLPKLDIKQQQQLLLIGTSGSHFLPIARGENAGKKLHYHNPIEYVSDLGSWQGESRTLSKTVAGHPNIKEWIVIAQRLPIGAITAAGKLSLTQ